MFRRMYVRHGEKQRQSNRDNATRGAPAIGVAVAAGLTTAAQPARAAAVKWINPAGGSWSFADNWNTNTVPAGGDAVSIINSFRTDFAIQETTDYDATSALASLDINSQMQTELTVNQFGFGTGDLYIGTETLADSNGHATFVQGTSRTH